MALLVATIVTYVESDNGKTQKKAVPLRTVIFSNTILIPQEFQACIQCILILLTSLSPKLHIFFFYNPLILISIAHRHTGVGSSTIAFSDYKGPHPWRRLLPPAHYLLSTGWGLMWCSCIMPEGWLTWHCAGTTAIGDSWTQRSCRIPKTLFHSSFPSPWLSQSLSHTPFMNLTFTIPWALGIVAVTQKSRLCLSTPQPLILYTVASCNSATTHFCCTEMPLSCIWELHWSMGEREVNFGAVWYCVHLAKQ